MALLWLLCGAAKTNEYHEERTGAEAREVSRRCSCFPRDVFFAICSRSRRSDLVANLRFAKTSDRIFLTSSVRDCTVYDVGVHCEAGPAVRRTAPGGRRKRSQFLHQHRGVEITTYLAERGRAGGARPSGGAPSGRAVAPPSGRRTGPRWVAVGSPLGLQARHGLRRLAYIVLYMTCGNELTCTAHTYILWYAGRPT